MPAHSARRQRVQHGFIYFEVPVYRDALTVPQFHVHFAVLGQHAACVLKVALWCWYGYGVGVGKRESGVSKVCAGAL